MRRELDAHCICVFVFICLLKLAFKILLKCLQAEVKEPAEIMKLNSAFT